MSLMLIRRITVAFLIASSLLLLAACAPELDILERLRQNTDEFEYDIGERRRSAYNSHTYPNRLPSTWLSPPTPDRPTSWGISSTG